MSPKKKRPRKKPDLLGLHTTSLYAREPLTPAWFSLFSLIPHWGLWPNCQQIIKYSGPGLVFSTEVTAQTSFTGQYTRLPTAASPLAQSFHPWSCLDDCCWRSCLETWGMCHSHSHPKRPMTDGYRGTKAQSPCLKVGQLCSAIYSPEFPLIRPSLEFSWAPSLAPLTPWPTWLPSLDSCFLSRASLLKLYAPETVSASRESELR